MGRIGNFAGRIALDGLFTALGLIVFIIEGFIPSVLPGAKIGLANIFSLVALIAFGPVDALAVVVARTLLGSLFAGNFSAIMYSLSGGLAALAVSAVLIYVLYPRISVMAVSIFSAMVHNVVQLLVFMGLFGMQLIVVYLPYLALAGVVAGAVVGAVVLLIFKRIPPSLFERAMGAQKNTD